VGKDHSLIRRLRTLTFGLLTPFYFIRAGSFVSVSALMAAPVTLLVLFGAKSFFKAVAVYPAVRVHKYDGNAGAYYTLMMSTASPSAPSRRSLGSITRSSRRRSILTSWAQSSPAP